jgi:OmcA/MtrC family decaheme c-type cytochrome
VTVTSGQVGVTFTLTDASGLPLTPVLAAAQSAQQARVRFTIAHVEEYSGGGDFDTPFDRYVNDIDATRPKYDSGGTLEAVDATAGVYRYTFKTQLQGFDPSRTYSAGLQVDRTFEGRQLSANPVFDFVPAGGTPRIRQAVTTQECNGCHDPLIMHGNRREVRLCLLCHAEAAVDEKGRSIDFRNMIHKIHRGKDLPSVANGPPGATYAIFSSFAGRDVVFAQKDANGVVTGIGFPRTLQDCEVCHEEGATAEFYHDRPSAAACAACHDDTNPGLVVTAAGPPGTKHFQSKGYADGDCAFCHVADSGKEFDISVVGAHVIPNRSRQLAGLYVEIVGLANHAAGQTPTVAFKVSDTAGTPLRDLSGLNRLAFNIAGPTSDYTNAPLTPVAVGAGASGTLTGPDDAGVFQYTPTITIPADASGTWAIGAESRRVVQLTTVDPIEPKTATEAAVNPVVTFTVDDSTALVRRTVVEDQNCGACHGEFSKTFSIHGNLRNQTQYCVMCHNPNHSDVSRRMRDPDAVARGDQTGSVDFKVMIHKIHSGEELEQKPYLIYGFGAAPPQGQGFTIHDFAEVRFPGDRRHCETCHATGTFLLPPFPGTALGTRVAHLDPATGNEVEDGRLGPIRSVCTACHDGDDAAAHAATMTTSSGEEACEVCHEEGRDFAVSEVHAGRR